MAGSEGRARLFENIVSMFVLQGATYILPLLTVPYLVRVLGPSDYGLMSFAQSFVAYFVIIADYGFNVSAVGDVNALRHQPDALSRFVASVMVVKVSLASIGFLVMSIITFSTSRLAQDWFLFALAYVAVLGNVIFPLWLFRGLQIMKFMSFLIILGRAITLIGVFVFVHKQSDLGTAVFIQASALMISGIPGFILVRKIGPVGFVVPRLKDISKVLREGWHLFLSSSAITLYTSTNIFVLGLLGTPAEVGYFAVAYKLVSAVAGLIFPLADAIYPHALALVSTSKAGATVFMSRIFWLQLFGTSLLSISLFIFAGHVLSLLVGPGYEPSIILMKIMALTPTIIGIGVVFGQILLVFEMKEVFSRIIVRTALLNIIIIAPLTLRYGATGAAISVLISELANTLWLTDALRSRNLLLRIIVIPRLRALHES